MNITQALFSAANFPLAREQIQTLTKCRCVKDIPLSTVGQGRQYVMTEAGEVFFMKQYRDGVLVTQRQPEKRVPKHGRPRIRLLLGPKEEKAYDVACLVWCTFIKGEYDSSIMPQYKDSNPKNYSLANLIVAGTSAQLFTLPDYSGNTYHQYFRDYCNYCERLHFNIGPHDAKDIVSNAFLEVSDKCDSADHLRILWKLTVRKRILDYFYRQNRHVAFDEEWMQPTYMTTPEIDFSLLCHRKSEAAAIAALQRGLSVEDYAEVSGLKRSTVSSHVSRGVEEIRNRLRATPCLAQG